MTDPVLNAVSAELLSALRCNCQLAQRNLYTMPGPVEPDPVAILFIERREVPTMHSEP